MSDPHIECPSCERPARVVSVRHEVTVGRRRVEVDDEFTQCDACDETFYTSAQSEQLQLRAKAAVERAENRLSPQDIKRIRKRLALTQDEFDELLGVAEKSSARWETGRVRPNISTDRLIRLIGASRKNAEILAGINGVALSDACYVPEPAPHLHHSGVAAFSTGYGEMSRHIYLRGTVEEPGLERDQHLGLEALNSDGLVRTDALVGEPRIVAQLITASYPARSFRGSGHDH